MRKNKFSSILQKTLYFKALLFTLVFCFASAEAQELGGKMKEIKASIKKYDNGDIVIEEGRNLLGMQYQEMMGAFFFDAKVWNSLIAEIPEEERSDPNWRWNFLNEFFKSKRCGTFENAKFSNATIYKNIDAGIPVIIEFNFSDTMYEAIKERLKIRETLLKTKNTEKYLKESSQNLKERKGDAWHVRGGFIIGYNKETKEYLFVTGDRDAYWLREADWKNPKICKMRWLVLIKLNANYDKVYKELLPQSE